MDRNTITGLIVIFVILIGYSIWVTPSQEEKQALQHKQDSIARVMHIQDSIAAIKFREEKIRDSLASIHKTEIVRNDTVEAVAVDQDKLGAFANASVGIDTVYYLESDLMRLGVSSRGGKIISVQLKEFVTWDSLPLMLVDPNKAIFGMTFFSGGRLINTDNLYYQPVVQEGENAGDIVVSKTGSGTLSMRLYVNGEGSQFNKDHYIEYIYTLKGDDYMMDFDINFVGMDKYVDAGTNFIDLKWKNDLQQIERTVDRFNGPTIYYKFYQDEVNYLSETKDDSEDLTTRIKWVSQKHKFFSSTLIAKDYFLNAKVSVVTEKDKAPPYLRTMDVDIGLPYNISGPNNIQTMLYFGPNKYKTLRQYHLSLEQQIPLGWSFFLMQWINRYAVLPVFNFLEGFGWNYGIIILVLTILLKIVLFPVAYKSYISSAKMRVLKPDIEEVTKKFTKKEDAMKKQQATMELYRKAGVNPMAGCIPMLLQFPILIAMFRFFPAAFELRQQSFLWATDLSSYDSILNLPFNIPFYGSHVSLFTLLMTVSTIIYTKVNNDLMGTSQQMPGMKTMMYIMPIMFLGIFNNYASGLSYYYFLANILTFAQMWVIRQFIDEDKIRRKIEANKKRPSKKKSGWQKRLEDAAKARGYKPPRK